MSTDRTSDILHDRNDECVSYCSRGEFVSDHTSSLARTDVNWVDPAAAESLSNTEEPLHKKIISLELGPEPRQLYCPQCRSLVQSVISDVYDWWTFLTCFGLTATGLCLLAWVPFLLSNFRCVRHRCPRCQYTFGRFHRRRPH